MLVVQAMLLLLMVLCTMILFHKPNKIHPVISSTPSRQLGIGLPGKSLVAAGGVVLLGLLIVKIWISILRTAARSMGPTAATCSYSISQTHPWVSVRIHQRDPDDDTTIRRRGVSQDRNFSYAIVASCIVNWVHTAYCIFWFFFLFFPVFFYFSDRALLLPPTL